MDPEIQHLRQALADSRRPVAAVRPRCPADLREAIVARARHIEHEGHTLRRIAETFDVPHKTLSNWLQRHQGSLRPVAVVSSFSTAPRSVGGIRIVTPQGYLIEGLGVDEK
jgi:transposase-like protein